MVIICQIGNLTEKEFYFFSFEHDKLNDTIVAKKQNAKVAMLLFQFNPNRILWCTWRGIRKKEIMKTLSVLVIAYIFL